MKQGFFRRRMRFAEKVSIATVCALLQLWWLPERRTFVAIAAHVAADWHVIVFQEVSEYMAGRVSAEGFHVAQCRGPRDGPVQRDEAKEETEEMKADQPLAHIQGKIMAQRRHQGLSRAHEIRDRIVELSQEIVDRGRHMDHLHCYGFLILALRKRELKVAVSFKLSSNPHAKAG